MYKNKKILAHGIGFIFLLGICILFLLGSLFLCLCFFLKIDTEMFQRWYVLILGVIGLSISIYEIVILFNQGYVLFSDSNQFINKGKNPKHFPPINENCQDFVSYKLSAKLMAQCIEFVMKNGKKIYFHSMQFSKKQNLDILREIQNRGGLKDQEIKLDRYYF